MDNIKAAIFFDNNDIQLENVKEACSHITTIKVAESSPECISIKFRDEPLASYIESLGSNLYLQSLLKMEIDQDVYDPLSGITKEHIVKFNLWEAKTRHHGERAVIFDWDRTISKFEGFYPVQFTTYAWLESALEYLCGGKERLSMLRDFIQRIDELTIRIYILTNNTGCKDEDFPKYVYQLFEGVPVEIICGMDYGFHKGIALKSNMDFKEMCTSLSGGKRKKTRHRHLYRKKSMKRKK
jgi:hypothetical protein